VIRRRIAAVATATVLGAAGTGLTGLTAAEAAWPGTNGTIYFVCRPTGTGFSGQDICRVNPDGSGLVNLTNTHTQRENTPDVSRYGTKVSFTRTIGSDTRVWVMNPDGSGQQQVTTVPSDGSSFTPDGRIAFRAQVDDGYEFWVVPLTGGGHTVLGPASGLHTPPRYTASGSWLYTKSVPVSPGSGTETSQVFVVTDGVHEQVTESSPSMTSNNFPAWSPLGDKVVYQRSSSGQTDLYTVPSGGGTEVRLTTTAAPVEEGWANFSPNGTKLVFHQQDSEHDFFHLQLMISDSDGSDPAPIATPGYDYAGFAVWSPTPTTPPPTASFAADAPSKITGTKKVKVTLRCLGDVPCVVTYGAKLRVPAYGATAKRTFTIRDAKVTVAGRTAKVVKLKLAKAAKIAVKAALKAGKRPKYKGQAAARRPGGQAIRTVRFTVKIVD
jgi:Tol biopolymer transport system component